MSSTKIRDVLKLRDMKTFGTISRGTIDGWIDRTGDRPRWSDNALKLAEKGNEQGGHGGQIGVLVCHMQTVFAMSNAPLFLV